MRRLTRTALALALAASAVAATTGVSAGARQQPAPHAPPGAAAWHADGLPDPARTAPDRISAFFRALPERRVRELARTHPGVVGNLDGAPVALRYAANARALHADGRHPRLADRHVLAFDPRGRGLAAVVEGDLTTARHVAVLVPGSDTDATRLTRLADSAAHLRRAAGPGTAVIAWAGYTTPVGLGADAATGRLAEAAVPRLDRLTDGLRATGTPATTLVCHSYGTVVCGLAAGRLDGVKDVVALGSPGMRAANADALRTTARVWAARDDEDWITKVPHVRLAGLGHGPDPADPGFGARPVPTAGVHAHEGYLTPGTASLDAVAALTRGETSETGETR